MDCRVSIKNLRVMAFVGCWDYEKDARQEIGLDVAFDIAADALRDDIGAVVNYDEAAALVRAICESGRWSLIEKMAVDVAQALMRQFLLIKWVSVEIHKSAIEDCSGVSTKVELKRGDLI